MLLLPGYSHAICSGCRAKVVENKCPTCRVAYEAVDTRCLMLEQVASKHAVPCKFEAEGCAALVDYEHKAGHETGCDFRPLTCLKKCGWSGLYSEIIAHTASSACDVKFTDCREKDVQKKLLSVAELSLPTNDSWWTMVLLRAFNRDFLVYVSQRCAPRCP